MYKVESMKKDNGLGAGTLEDGEIGGGVGEAPSPPSPWDKDLVGVRLPFCDLVNISGSTTGIICRLGPRQHFAGGHNLFLLPCNLLRIWGAPRDKVGSDCCSCAVITTTRVTSRSGGWGSLQDPDPHPC